VPGWSRHPTSFLEFPETTMLKVNKKGEYQSYTPGATIVFLLSLGYLFYTCYRTFPVLAALLPF
jgi:hypothetical protein